ncbi:MAG TPA: hypothetical protein VM532_19060 [Burkholderiales bacterium]|nr:hypothetical protein [Burkholderiales bacterium]
MNERDENTTEVDDSTEIQNATHDLKPDSDIGRNLSVEALINAIRAGSIQKDRLPREFVERIKRVSPKYYPLIDSYLSENGHSLADIENFNVFASCGKSISEKLKENLDNASGKKKKDAALAQKFGTATWSLLRTILFRIPWEDKIAEVKEDALFHNLIGRFAEYLALKELGKTINAQAFAKAILGFLADNKIDAKQEALLFKFRRHVFPYGLDSAIDLQAHSYDDRALQNNSTNLSQISTALMSNGVPFDKYKADPIGIHKTLQLDTLLPSQQAKDLLSLVVEPTIKASQSEESSLARGERDFGVSMSSSVPQSGETRGAAGKKRAHSDVEESEEGLALKVLQHLYGEDHQWRQPVAEWVSQVDGSRRLTFYQHTTDGERIEIPDDDGNPLQLSDEQVNKCGVDPQRFTKRARVLSPTNSDVAMGDAPSGAHGLIQDDLSESTLWEWETREPEPADLEEKSLEKDHDRHQRESELEAGVPKAAIDTFMYTLCDTAANVRTSPEINRPLYESAVASTEEDSTLQTLWNDLDGDIFSQNPRLEDLFKWLDQLRRSTDPEDVPEKLKTPEAIREVCDELRLTTPQWQELAWRMNEWAEKWELPRRDFPRFKDADDYRKEPPERWCNPRFPIRRLPDASKIKAEYSKDAQGLECHDNVECVRAEITQDDRERTLEIYKEILKDPDKYFAGIDSDVKERTLNKYQYALDKPEDYFCQLEADIKALWMTMKRNEFPSNADLFETSRLKPWETKPRELRKQLGRKLKNFDKQPVCEVVDAIPAVPIGEKNLEEIGEYIDEHGKDSFENSSIAGSAGIYYATVGTDYPASLMNDEDPPIADGEVLEGFQTMGDMLIIEPKIHLKNKDGDPDVILWPHTLQVKPTKPPYESTLGYGFEKHAYWQDRRKELNTSENYRKFYDDVVGRHLRVGQFHATWRRLMGEHSDVKFVQAVIDACKKVMSQPIADDGTSLLVKGEGDESKRWNNWHIKGFKINVTGQLDTVLVSCTDREGTKIDDIRVLPNNKTPQALFEEMRFDASKRIGKPSTTVPGLSPTPQQQNTRGQSLETGITQDTDVRVLPVHGSSPLRSQSSSPAAESSRAAQSIVRTGSRGRGRK